MIKDSGNRTAFESGALRDIQEGKGRCDLLPLDIIDLWCDDGLQGTLYYVGKYLKCKDNTDYFELILNQFAEEHQAKRIAAGENVNNKLYSLEEYRWNLVLELAKHFEEGAKKYGDRNWEKGIPCDRYIDSAVRHYCKWRAEWDDEPHDRAFIWNVVCCEWTRQQYGWNLERLGEKDDPNQLMQEFLDKMGNGDFKIEGGRRNGKVFLTQCLNRYARNVTGGVELYDDIGQYVGYVHGFTDSGVTGSKETETIIRSIVESSWGLLTLNPFTLEKIIEDHGYISDLHFILELYKDPSDIKLPEQWCLIKRKRRTNELYN